MLAVPRPPEPLQAYEGLKEGRTDICCIVRQTQVMCVKPQFIDGSRPCCKTACKSLCFVDKFALPRDNDVPGRVSVCFPGCFLPFCPGPCDNFCCDSKGKPFQPDCCCPTVAPISEKAFGSFDTNFAKLPEDKKQCLCCAAAPVLCLNLSCFIPESFRESHGYSNKGTLLCCEYESMGELLPETEGEDTEELLLHNMENIKCVMPSVCFKTKYRHGPCEC